MPKTNLDYFLEKFKIEHMVEPPICSLHKRNFEHHSCAEISCEGCQVESLKWLAQPYQKPKPKLTISEKTILENLPKEYEWIVRNKDGNLFLFDIEPVRERTYWDTNESMHEFEMFNNLFQFVQWEDGKPYHIPTLLENCEVVEDA